MDKEQRAKCLEGMDGDHYGPSYLGHQAAPAWISGTMFYDGKDRYQMMADCEFGQFYLYNFCKQFHLTADAALEHYATIKLAWLLTRKSLGLKVDDHHIRRLQKYDHQNGIPQGNQTKVDTPYLRKASLVLSSQAAQVASLVPSYHLMLLSPQSQLQFVYQYLGRSSCYSL